mmetsp:Transcript_27038/g.51116  ORF Transcript_27038/g.51116 Transcript_27038/m.51116 type:complete len:176 (-) Transcript_27038:256-783(-)|eukprot:CAMPEP_0201662522 /NCGR_PEP_ID=MMETSP0494-20130426/4593_1 /ASSEMBLY_ACC=CAM_ASM_000839 /TAXON_ID=420259 /ORGANISM="Thalassiosira gravida, Strain GMp14c1" /LENGTH=175 /DNA_ID=CAMNT_0048140909 /DNA_START=161 /DNA_END=688 /DNA_ORIENTATION=+
MDLIVGFPKRNPHPQDEHDSMELLVNFSQGCSLQNMPPPPRVHFADQLSVTFIANLSLQYKYDMWYTEREMTSFRHQTGTLLRSILSSDMTVAQYAEMNMHDTSAFMGLERYFSQNRSRETDRLRREICREVIAEQQRHMDAGIYDPEATSIVSEGLSEKSRRRARIIGLLHMTD